MLKDGLRQNEDVSIHHNLLPYIKAELFQDFIENMFIPYFKFIREQLNMEEETVILMLDLCKSHWSETILKKLGENNIYAFPFHTKTWFQLWDVSFFGTLKEIGDGMSHKRDSH